MSDNTRMQTGPWRARNTCAISLFHGRAFKSKKLRPIGITAGGARRDRTDDLLLAKQALSQLSYGPALRYPAKAGMVGLGRFELPTSRLSSARSNQLSYRPNSIQNARARPTTQNPLRAKGCSNDAWIAWARPRRKRNEDGEVLQMDMPILKLTCPDVSKRSDRNTRMRVSEGSSLERR